MFYVFFTVFTEMMRAAQIFFMVGVVAIAVCFVASVIYLVRKYKTVTGEMCLAGAVMPAGKQCFRAKEIFLCSSTKG